VIWIGSFFKVNPEVFSRMVGKDDPSKGIDFCKMVLASCAVYDLENLVPIDFNVAVLELLPAGTAIGAFLFAGSLPDLSPINPIHCSRPFVPAAS
jgi:hypothetical protein